MTDASMQLPEDGGEMPASVLLSRFVALLQQKDVDHLDFAIKVRDSDEIAWLRISLIGPKPGRVS